MVQNGLKTRNECRQLENDPPIPGGDELTAQINLAPLARVADAGFVGHGEALTWAPPLLRFRRCPT